MTETQLIERLAQRLWEERQVVTVLLYKVTVTKLLLAADERRFVPDAVREVDRTMHLLRRGEAARDEALRDLAAHWRMDPADLTLQWLARSAPPPYHHVFSDHLTAFRTLTAEIEGAARENRALTRVGLGSVRDQLDLLTGVPSGPTTYDAQGHVGGHGAPGSRVWEVL